MIEKNEKNLTVMKDNLIDPKCVWQADQNVMEGFFVKINNYIKLLYSEKKVPWECASNIPPECMSNMDDIAMNAHNHFKKPIANKLHLVRLFQ